MLPIRPATPAPAISSIILRLLHSASGRRVSEGTQVLLYLPRRAQ
jgi:hypothetical protein